MANKKYKLTDGNMWATDGIHDFGQNKTQRTINSEVNSALGGKAPTNHASTATTYGAASTSNYGHVKLSNTTPSMDGTAAVGDSTDVARANHVHPSDTSRVPTSRKVNNKQLSSDITLSAADVSAVPTSRKVNNKQLSSDITLAASDVGAAPTDHASTATTYGKGTSSNYGHVKISDSLTDTTTAATGGVVPSMKAVSDLNGAINSKAPIASPTFTGTPKSVTPTSGDNTTNIATTAFVQSAATNRIYYKLIANNGTITIQTGSGHSYMILGFRVGSIAQNHAWYAIDPWGGILKLSETTAVTVTFSNSVVTVTNNSGGYLPLLVIDFYDI